MKSILKTIKIIYNSLQFANVGHLRELDQLLDARGHVRIALPEEERPSVPASPAKPLRLVYKAPHNY